MLNITPFDVGWILAFSFPRCGRQLRGVRHSKRIKVMRREAIVEVEQRNKPSSDQTFSREIASFTKRSFCLITGISLSKGPYEECPVFHSVGYRSLMNHGNKFRAGRWVPKQFLKRNDEFLIGQDDSPFFRDPKQANEVPNASRWFALTSW